MNVLAASWFDIGNGLGFDFQAMAKGAVIPAMALGFVIYVGFKTKNAGAVLAAIVFAGVCVWGALNMGLLSDTTDDTVTKYDGNPVQPVDPPNAGN